MDILTDSRQVSRLEIVETGRRRRWSEAEKLRIVEESFSAPRMVSATARHHGVAKQLLFSWRKAYREGQLGGSQADGFLPAQIVPVTCPCRFPPVEVRVRPSEGRTNEASQVYGRADYRRAARA